MWILFGPLFFAILSSLLTGWIRSITPGLDAGTKANVDVTRPIASNDVEATAIPDSGNSDPDAEDPPPYQPPAQEVTPSPALVPALNVPKVKRSSAQSFVMGTALLLGIMASLFLAGLAMQALIFCGPWSPVSFFLRIVYWIVFSIPCLWASVGVSCWLMLLRDLWGPAMKKRLPLKETGLIYGLFCVLFAPFAFVMFVVGGGAVKAVEMCQRRFCGDALEDEVEEGEEVLELEQGLRMEGGAGSAEGNRSGEEERIGLMGGIEK
jgi:hypothetical protein